MMNREEMNVETMEQVNGGAYCVKILDPECTKYVPYITIGEFTFKDEMLNSVKALTDHNLNVFVDRTSIFDDDSVCGLYTRSGFTSKYDFFGI